MGSGKSTAHYLSFNNDFTITDYQTALMSK